MIKETNQTAAFSYNEIYFYLQLSKKFCLQNKENRSRIRIQSLLSRIVISFNGE